MRSSGAHMFVGSFQKTHVKEAINYASSPSLPTSPYSQTQQHVHEHTHTDNRANSGRQESNYPPLQTKGYKKLGD
eukprot:1317845-Amorphochlora_amoeboformis.AAC.1